VTQIGDNKNSPIGAMDDNGFLKHPQDMSSQDMSSQDMSSQNMSARFHAAMPAMVSHAGIWEGTYRHLDADGQITETLTTRVRCEFPTDGPYVYIQHNHFTGEDGREFTATLPGVFRDGRLWWDTETFSGSCWQTLDGFILLNLDRKDEPGVSFHEIIMMAGGHTGLGAHRARTWHWFRDGKLFRRTLCDEIKTAL